MVHGVIPAVGSYDKLDPGGDIVGHPKGGHCVFLGLDVLQVVDPVDYYDYPAVVGDLLTAKY